MKGCVILMEEIRISRDKVNEFINRVFNFYNGKINMMNCPAVLDINWANR